jgi:spore germination protein
MAFGRQQGDSEGRDAGGGSPRRPPRLRPPGLRDKHGWPHRLLALIAWPLVALVGLALVGLTLVAHWAPAARHSLVVASIPYWNMQHDTSVVLANQRDVNEVSPWIYGLSSSGAIVPQYGHGEAATVTADMQKLEAAHLRMVPSIANVTGGSWSYQPVASILHNPALARQQVNAIVSLVEREHYAGIDIDYEQLKPADRQAFTNYITELAAALHAHGKVLSVAVFAQLANPKDNNQAEDGFQDYAALGKVADQIRIEGYNLHWANSAPGATAPIEWIRSVLQYATSQMPASKVVLGIPLYGYDWPDGNGPAQTVSWLQALRLSKQYGAAPSYNKTSQAPYFSYRADGHTHTVWFENGESSGAKFEAAKGAGIAGVYLWMYGYEDPATWPALRNALPTSGPGASSDSTAVP